MVLHALTDPSTILATGGIDEVNPGGATNGFIDAAGLATFVLIGLGFVLLIFIRGRASSESDSSRPIPSQGTEAA